LNTLQIDNNSSSHLQYNQNARRNELLIQNYAAIDTEYIQTNNPKKPFDLIAVAFVNSKGIIKAKHVSDFNIYPKPEKALVEWTISEILKYKLTIGWYSKGVSIQNTETETCSGKDSDLKVIDSICKYYNIPSIIGFDKRGIPYVRGYNNQYGLRGNYYFYQQQYQNKVDWYYYHIDLYNVYKKPLVKSIIYNNKYKDQSLESVSQAILNEGKFGNIKGSDIQNNNTSKDEVLQYVSQDAFLVMKLSKYHNYEILDLMNAISRITRLPFDRVCHTGISTWWTNIIKREVGELLQSQQLLTKKSYTGGYVIDPTKGYYQQPVYVLDVKSLYPTMMINHNISFDTVNCDCCKDDPNAIVPKEIMNIINEGLVENEKRDQSYWICKKKIGIVPKLLSRFRDERFRQEELGNTLMQLALKNLINSIYGLFGTDFFEFADYRVAELTTAFGRKVLQYMKETAKEVYGFDVIYGDTDSIFVTSIMNIDSIDKFITECWIVDEVDVEVDKVFVKFLITKKKHYIGIYEDPTKGPEIKGMEDIKSDRPPWIQKLEKQFALDLKNNIDPIVNLKKEYRRMEVGQVPIEELQIKLVLQKNPNEYPENSLQRRLSLKKGGRLQQGDSIIYYKSSKIGGGTTNSLYYSRKKYLEMLESIFEDVITLMGFDFKREVIGFTSLSVYE
jgi:DNA polymerase elongation subunit (family B)